MKPPIKVMSLGDVDDTPPKTSFCNSPQGVDVFDRQNVCALLHVPLSTSVLW